MRRGTEIGDVVRMPEDGESTAYVDDRLQVADILEWILESRGRRDSGEVTVYQTTFSISDEFLRRLHTIGGRHPECRFEVVIDRKALQKITQLGPMIRNVYDRVYIADNHSKILLVDFGGGDMTAVVTSQNLTRGNRHESAVLSRDRGVTERLMSDYKELIKNRSASMFEELPMRREDLPDREGAPDEGVTVEIERLAGYFVPPSDIATVLGLDPMELRDAIASRNHPWGLAYRRGKAKAKIAVRAKEMEFAEMGSPIAIQNVRENLIDMESEED